MLTTFQSRLPQFGKDSKTKVNGSDFSNFAGFRCGGQSHGSDLRNRNTQFHIIYEIEYTCLDAMKSTHFDSSRGLNGSGIL